MKYGEIRGVLKTGDVLLFNGKSRVSSMIKLLTGSRWSHVALVYVVQDETDPRGSVFCWESTTLNNLFDADTGRLTKGVQRVELSERLERYRAEDGKVSVRRLNRPLTKEMLGALSEYRHAMSGRPYERSKIELLRAAWDGPFGGNAEDFSSVFCSELVAGAFKAMGLLAPEEPANEFTPHDFSVEGRLMLAGGWELGEEMEIE